MPKRETARLEKCVNSDDEDECWDCINHYYCWEMPDKEEGGET